MIAYVLQVKVEMELEIQQCERTKAVREEQLERLTQICQEQAVSTRDSTWKCAGHMVSSINSRAQNNSALTYILVNRSTYIVGMRPNLCHLKFYSPLRQANILNLSESVNTSITAGGQQCSAKVSSCFMIILLRAQQRRTKPAIITDEKWTLSS